jgi:hypothetical protein
MWNWRASGEGMHQEQGFLRRWQCWNEASVPTEEALIGRVQAPIQECANFTSSL